MIEQSNRTVRSECAYKKCEHDQSVVMLLRETVKYPEHGTPFTCQSRLWTSWPPRVYQSSLRDTGQAPERPMVTSQLRVQNYFLRRAPLGGTI